MVWSENLYIGEKLRDDVQTLIRNVEEGHPRAGLYLLTLPANPKNLLDILKASELKKDIVRKSLPRIVGMAADKQEAFELSRKLVQDLVDKNDLVFSDLSAETL